jgi:hypothetical protein
MALAVKSIVIDLQQSKLKLNYANIEKASANAVVVKESLNISPIRQDKEKMLGFSCVYSFIYRLELL